MLQHSKRSVTVLLRRRVFVSAVSIAHQTGLRNLNSNRIQTEFETEFETEFKPTAGPPHGLPPGRLGGALGRAVRAARGVCAPGECVWKLRRALKTQPVRCLRVSAALAVRLVRFASWLCFLCLGGRAGRGWDVCGSRRNRSRPTDDFKNSFKNTHSEFKKHPYSKTPYSNFKFNQ